VTKVHKITLLVVDHDDLGADEVVAVLEGARYPNHCIHPSVATIETREVKWDDAHPLNQTTSWRSSFAALFGDDA
jgi:hypothetical protein